MTYLSINAEGLSKRFRIGQRVQYLTLRETLSGVAHWPNRILRTGRRARSVAGENGSEANTVWALQDVSFQVCDGEVLGIIGRNGAGKSTLLKILARITKPTHGRAQVYGRIGSLLEVGTGFHPELTGRENIFLNGAVLGMRRREITQKFDEIVDFAEVERFIDTPVKRYSSGMYMRLAFSVAAHLEPEILIVDEVLAVGDAAFQKKCMGKMGDVAQQGRTILFVSHNMNAIQRLCSRAILLEQGRLVMDGPTPDVVNTFLSSGVSDAPPAAWLPVEGVNRKGSGQVQVRALRYSGPSSELGSQLQTGGHFEISFELHSDAPRSIGSLAATLYDRSGAKLVNADTISLGKQIDLKEGKNCVTLRIQQLHLKPGSYLLGWWISDPLGRVFDFADSGFTVEVSDREGSSLGARPKHDGPVACDFEIVEVS
jgi:lipopolysaccharide transport system ATP-binding protein